MNAVVVFVMRLEIRWAYERIVGDVSTTPKYHIVVVPKYLLKRHFKGDVFVAAFRTGSLDDTITIDDVFYFASRPGFILARAIVSHVQKIATESTENLGVPLVFDDMSSYDEVYIVGFSRFRLMYPFPLIETTSNLWKVFSADPLRHRKVNVYYRTRGIIDRIHVRTAERLVREGILFRRGESEFVLKSHLPYRNYIWHRDKFTCRYCLASLRSRTKRTRDHVIPQSSKRDHRPFNLVLSCPSCNQSKMQYSTKQFSLFRLYIRDPRTLVITPDAVSDYCSLIGRNITETQAKSKLKQLLKHNFRKIIPHNNGVDVYCNKFRLSVVDNQIVRVTAIAS